MAPNITEVLRLVLVLAAVATIAAPGVATPIAVDAGSGTTDAGSVVTTDVGGDGFIVFSHDYLDDGGSGDDDPNDGGSDGCGDSGSSDRLC